MAADDKHAVLKEIHEKVAENNLPEVQKLLNSYGISVDACDEHGMSALQLACYRGSLEIVQMLLDQGANVNWDKHEHQYTALHFAAIAGKPDVCHLLLNYGAKPQAVNAVGRTASQMAAFVGNHSCVAVINNFINRSEVDYYTELKGVEKEPKLLPFLAEPLHKFITGAHVHPVKVALDLKQYPRLLEHLEQIGNVLELMSEKEMKRGMSTNEIMSFKLHYYKCIVLEMARLRKNWEKQKNQSAEASEEVSRKGDPIEMFIKKMLRVNRVGDTAEQKNFLIDSVRSFHARECATFRQMVTVLSRADAPSPVSVISDAINGQRGFVDAEAECWTCGEKGANKKCSKCRFVRYCDRECQRLHWFVHKYMCNRPSTASDSTPIITQDTVQAALDSKMSSLSVK